MFYNRVFNCMYVDVQDRCGSKGKPFGATTQRDCQSEYVTEYVNLQS